VIIADGERLQLIQVDFTTAISLDKSRSHIAEFQPLPDESRTYAKTSRNFFHRLAPFDEFTERNELIGGMHRQAERVLGEAHFNGLSGVNHLAGNSCRMDVQSLGLSRSSERFLPGE
jgi:hypothetical protein